MLRDVTKESQAMAHPKAVGNSRSFPRVIEPGIIDQLPVEVHVARADAPLVTDVRTWRRGSVRENLTILRYEAHQNSKGRLRADRRPFP